ncbi:hypothetical protein NIES3804_33000 [Microcystis aeruginosa NIES-3804]|uniref:Ribbon-helix-helix protein CopG domain-containing protein n=2 Tax=Microcystis aeruginosa TaxID=1126 RepID=A0A6H9GNY9_MICAE|nr:CopG family transcriptional regulator [Microcystis aeruginosa]GCL51719.1 hypothetical protein NIES3804_33000 [Microcystis aeruginosa NIES-3804]
MYNVMYILKLAMVSKIRKQIYIEAEQNNLLKEKARQTGLSEAEIIRQAIDQHIISVNVSTSLDVDHEGSRRVKSPTPNLSAWEREKAFIAGLENRPSQPGKRDWQREDLYER